MTTEINNNFRTRPILLFGKTDRLAFNQMPGITLPQQMLQYSTIGRSSKYVAGTCLPLITLQNVQLYIQMTQKHRGQRLTHPSRNLYGESKVKRFYSIIWVRAKDELTKPKCNKCCTTDSIGSLGESLNLMGQLCIPTHPFP